MHGSGREIYVAGENTCDLRMEKKGGVAMKESRYIIITVLALSLTMLSAAGAATKEEKTLNKEATEIDTTTNTAGGKNAVVLKLEKEFNVPESRITSLRDKKLGYGEITIVLSLCNTMPGGITDANVNEVMAMRAGPPVMGWGEIANKLGTKLGPVVSHVESVNKETMHEGRMHERTGNHEGMMGHGHEGMGGEGGSHGRDR